MGGKVFLEFFQSNSSSMDVFILADFNTFDILS